MVKLVLLLSKWKARRRAGTVYFCSLSVVKAPRRLEAVFLVVSDPSMNEL
jgi:hypothetical protein